MSNNRKIFSAAMVSLFVGLGAGGVAIGAAMDNVADEVSSQSGTILTSQQSANEAETSKNQIDFANGPLQCEIISEAKNGSLELASVVHVLEAATGTYVLKVASVGGPNRSTIQQGGYFSADEHGQTTLGKVRLGARGAVYKVDLDVVVDGQTISCNEQIGTT